MAVFYKLYQSQQKNSAYKGQWYARAAIVGETTIDDLADRIQQNCTCKKSDVLAVLTELVEAMTTDLQNGKRVVLKGFGAFKIGISSAPAAEKNKFSVSENIKGLHVLFQPEVKIDRSNRKRTKTFLAGTTVKELSVYDGGNVKNTSSND